MQKLLLPTIYFIHVQTLWSSLSWYTAFPFFAKTFLNIRISYIWYHKFLVLWGKNNDILMKYFNFEQ
ncbi:hypothetical protein QFZ80_005228 [Paenibacillus sp. V4I7]|nr:hypothetical protein [Paenibacillus sp. V4I7]